MLSSARLSFDAPFVKLFLSMPTELRKEKLTEWLNAFKGIKTSVEVLLRLGRETANFNTAFAEGGFYQEEMDKDEYQFIGIRIPGALQIYPEVSSGRKRFSIRFMTLSTDLETKQFSDWFNFELAKYN